MALKHCLYTKYYITQQNVKASICLSDIYVWISLENNKTNEMKTSICVNDVKYFKHHLFKTIFVQSFLIIIHAD